MLRKPVKSLFLPGFQYLLNILGIRPHRPEGFLEKLVEPLKPSGRFPSFLRRYGFQDKISTIHFTCV
jgi:hypothetical protein